MSFIQMNEEDLQKLRDRVVQLEQDNARLAKMMENMARYKSLEIERRTIQTKIQEEKT